MINDRHYEAGYAAGYERRAYRPPAGGTWQAVGAYQRGYNAGVEAWQLQARFNARPGV